MCHIICHHTVIHTLNLISILANLRICPHRTCGTVASRILVRDSINYIKNNIKDTNRNNSNNQMQIIRILVLMLYSAVIVVILKSIRPISDLKIIILIAIVKRKAIELVFIIYIDYWFNCVYILNASVMQTIKKRIKSFFKSKALSNAMVDG